MAGKAIAFLTSALSGARRVGWAPYVRYRMSPYWGRREPMPIRVSGTTIAVRPATPDLRVAFQSLGTEFNVLSGLLPQSFDGLIVDAGGYIGTAAIKLATMYPNATVVTIEPSSANFALLRRNIEGYANIRAVNGALFPTAGQKLNLVDRGTGEWGFTVVPGGDGRAHTAVDEVETVTFASILGEFPGKSIGIVKLDIEGGEFALLQGDDPILRDVPAVFAELHDRIVPGCSDAFRTFSRDRWIVRLSGEKLLSLKKDAVPETAASALAV